MNDSILPPRTLTVPQACLKLGVSRRTVYYYIKQGRLTTEGKGLARRILTASVEALHQQAVRDRKFVDRTGRPVDYV